MATLEFCYEDEIWQNLAQPQEVSVKSDKTLTCLVPPQDLNFIKELQSKNLQIYLGMVRPSDGTPCHGLKKFTYFTDSKSGTIHFGVSVNIYFCT